MPQTKTKRARRSNPGAGTRKARATHTRANSQRNSGAKSSTARRSTKKRAASGSRRKAAGPVSEAVRHLGNVPRQLGKVSSKVTNGHLGGVATRAKGLGAVGAAGLAGLGGVAGGIAFDRWNNSYSRTAALSHSRRGRSISRTFGGARAAAKRIRRRVRH
jgi:hypothetical protein